MIILFVIYTLIAIIGYLVALHIPLLILIPTTAFGIYTLVNSPTYRSAEIGQLGYLAGVIVLLLGEVIGVLVYVGAHWSESKFQALSKLVVMLFTP